ncbi:MAG: D-2-hydroxyacid dehydrogenase [Gammaproteobacteria bacterium]|nr:D-2-hydroxyacid dehydrogenase [Gammaproteobacteria bacterium]MYE83333.1 D-2-hydroxyacid dehydrogenase [Gammaproteobacteria bacterium]
MKILIIPGLTLREVTEADMARIRGAAGDADIVVSEFRDAMRHIADADVVLGFVTREMFLAARSLRWVQSISSGVDSFMYDEFRDSDVVLTSEKGLVGEHLADHAFGLLLMLTRQLATALKLGPDAWNHRPEMRRQEIELTSTVMGIFGFGGTGRAMARRAAAFGMTVNALDRHPVPTSAEVDAVWGPDRFEELLETSDVVSVCCPLTPETRDRFDAAAFARMRRTAYLVNVTRGEVMVEDDLADALESGEIAGAALDVAPREPLPADSRLWALPNVVMTPHTAGASQFRAARNLDRFVDNLARFRAGEPLEGVINKALGY